MSGQATKNILDKHPELVGDIFLYRMLLLPLELYVLKYFLMSLKPLNIRDAYTSSIRMLFVYFFRTSEELQGLSFEGDKHLIKSVMSSGYGTGIIKNSDREKVIREFKKKSPGLSETKFEKLWLDYLNQYGCKVPSYDKFKGIFNKFTEDMGILIKLSDSGKAIFYTLNPYFYQKVKTKRIEIIEKI